MLKRIATFFIISLFSVATFAAVNTTPATAMTSGGNVYNKTGTAVWVYDSIGYKYNVPAYSNSNYITTPVTKFQARTGMCGRYRIYGSATQYTFSYRYIYGIVGKTLYVDSQYAC